MINSKVKIIVFILLLLASLLAAKSLYHKFKVSKAPAVIQNPETQFISTNLYDLAVKRFRVDFDEDPGLYNAIDMVGSSILWADSHSNFYLLDESKKAHKLNIPTIEMNKESFLEAVGEDDFLPSRYFSLKDISIVQDEQNITLYVSHHYWNESCYTVRLSTINFVEQDVNQNSFSSSWETIFESSPCLPLFSGDEAFRGDEAGGRISHLNDGQVLLTVGHHEFSGLSENEHFSGESVPNYAQDSGAQYGKIVLIEPETGMSRVYSSGHRNPQGLVITSEGSIISTEHGPKGGDELNIIIDGGNYGWPNASYGTQYNEFTWPLAEAGGFHDGYSEPLYAWVPSVAISSLTEVNGPMFENWQGDLLIGSMKMRNIYRVKYKEGKVLYAEPIPVDLDVRDILEQSDGTIIAINRRNQLIEIKQRTD